MRKKRSRLSSLILAVVLAVGLLPGGAALPLTANAAAPNVDWYGDGSETTYEISTADELAGLAGIVNGTAFPSIGQDSFAGKEIILADDIDLSDYQRGKGWVPIGNDTAYFEGNFDGRGHVITGLYINDSELDYAGLFGFVDNGGIKYLGVEGADVNGRNMVGGVVSYIQGYGSYVENCYVTGSITGHIYVAGIAGWLSRGQIKNCYTTCSISGNQALGGIAGSIQTQGKVENCFSTGSVSGDAMAGGIAGSYNSGSVKNCAALNPYVKGRSFTGRVLGGTIDTGLADNVAFEKILNAEGGNPLVPVGNPGDDSGSHGLSATAVQIASAGFFEAVFGDDDAWNYAEDSLPSLKGVGGKQSSILPPHILDELPPFRGEGTEENPYLIKNAPQLAKLATLVNAGDTDYNDKHYQLVNDVDLSDYRSGAGWTPIGSDAVNRRFKGNFNGCDNLITGLYINNVESNSIGLFGYVQSGTIQDLRMEGVEITGGANVGGIAGYILESSIKNCYLTGEIHSTGNYAGGIAGIVETSSIESSYAAGSVSSTGSNTGGIAGSVDNGGSVKLCFTANSVSGGVSVGGIAGVASNGTIENCYTTGSVSGDSTAGGIVGYVSSSSIRNCYAAGDVTGARSSIGGIAGKVETGSMLESCAALNPYIKGSSFTGRVAGYSGGVLNNNAAFDGMQDGENGQLLPFDNDPGDNNGFSVTVKEIIAAEFWETKLAWDISNVWGDPVIWYVERGKLPIFQGVNSHQNGELPAHLLQLRSLVLSSGVLSPAFNSNVLTYEAGVANSVSSITVTAEAENDTSLLKINGTAVQNGVSSEPIPLAVGKNTVKIEVASPNGSVGNVYTVNVTRAGSASSGGGSGTTNYTIKFDSKGGSSVSDQTVGRNASAKEPAAPTREGYTFTGWYTDKECTEAYDFTKAVTASLTLYAGWREGGGIDGPIDPSGSGNVINPEDYLEVPFISGYPDGTFAPGNEISRGEVMQLLYNLFGTDADTGILSNYSDSPSTHWAANAIAWGVESRILTGYEDSTIRPDAAITRAEIAVILERIGEKENLISTGTGAYDSFTDIAGHWAEKSILHLAGEGIVQGYGNGIYGPKNPVTRAEAVTKAALLTGRSERFTEGISFTDIHETHWAYNRIMNAVNGVRKDGK